jgi:hypothetical protein
MGRLDVREAKWTEVVNGGTTFTGKVTVPDNPMVADGIRANTVPYGSSIYALPGDGSISFGGPIVNRDWDSDTNTLTITAIDWKSWFYRLIIGPKVGTTDPWTQNFTNTDQLAIASYIIDRASATYNNGTPPIESAFYPTGVLRNYIVTGVEFKSLGTHLDELGSLSNGGFEWEVEPYIAGDGYPKIRVQFYIPQRGSTVQGLVFRKTPAGGNILKITETSDDASAVASRIWAIGEGPNAESTPWASDESPALAGGYTLRTDQTSQYSGNFTLAQLASYARTERLYRADYLSALSFLVRMDAPSMFSYTKGDRCRVQVEDRFMNFDISNCRILGREMDPDNNTVTLTVNLNDREVPEVDSGGAV